MTKPKDAAEQPADAKTTTLTHPDTWKRRRWQKAFLAALRDSGNVRYACEQVSVTRQSAYEYRSRHPRFARQWDDAMEDACDALEAEAWRRAMEGNVKPVFYKGKPIKDDHGNVIVIREYSDALHALLLKAHRPDKFRDRHELMGPNGAPLNPATVTFFIPDNARGDASERGHSDPAPAGSSNSLP